MSGKINRDLARRLCSLEEASVQVRFGNVEDDSPLTISLNGADGTNERFVGVTASPGWTPQIGQRIAALVWGNDLILLGGGISTDPGNDDFPPHTHPESDIVGLISDLAGKQPLDSDLTSIAALTTTTFGRARLEDADAAALRTALDIPFASVRATNAQTWDSDIANLAEFDTNDEQNDITIVNSANATGTVAKTNGSATVTGTGTAFTTELVVGDKIRIGAENRWVSAIASDTSLTTTSTFSTSASGQTLVIATTKLTITKAGLYVPEGLIIWGANATGKRRVQVRVNNSVPTGWTADYPTSTGTGNFQCPFVLQAKRLAVNDVVTFALRQDSGGTLSRATNSNAGLRWVAA